MFKYELKRHYIKSNNYFYNVIQDTSDFITLTLGSNINTNLIINGGTGTLDVGYRDGEVRWDSQENKMYFFDSGEWRELNYQIT